jgi:hypothetical protein
LNFARSFPTAEGTSASVKQAVTTGVYLPKRCPIGNNEPKEAPVAKVPAFHSKVPGTAKHHNNDACTEGDNIESYNRVSGTGGLPLCDHCSRL